MDLQCFAVEPPDMPTLMQEACMPVHLACGSEDSLVSIDELRQFDPAAHQFSGAGHNAMVETPADVWRWFDETYSGWRVHL